MKKWIFLLGFILVQLYNNYLFAHEDKLIHPEITKMAADNPEFDAYLKNNLNFKNGVETQLLSNNGNTILYWLCEGSKQEDSPMCRASNHFHDPMNTKLWNAAGRSDNSFLIGLINQYCNLQSWPSPYYSDVTWATGFTSPTATPIPYNLSWSGKTRQ